MSRINPLDDVPTLIGVIGPYMGEIPKLREELYRLRRETFKFNVDLNKLLDGTPISIERTHDERWRYTIKTADGPTGAESWDSYEEAFREAMIRIGTLHLYGWDDDDEPC